MNNHTEYYGAVEKDGRMVCGRCRKPVNLGGYPDYIRARGKFTYEERHCPECGHMIAALREEEFHA